MKKNIVKTSLTLALLCVLTACQKPIYVDPPKPNHTTVSTVSEQKTERSKQTKPKVDYEKIMAQFDTKEGVDQVVRNYPDYIFEIPTEDADLKIAKEYEDLLRSDGYYYNSDEQGRPALAVAKLNTESITRQYGNEQKFNSDTLAYPKKNKQVKIEHPIHVVYNGWFWNRSHLIADQLGGESTFRNAITGTRTQNVGARNNEGGMRVPEKAAYEYIKKTQKELMYVVQPIYYQNERIPRLVKVTLYNDEINTTYITLNIAYGYTIDYNNASFKN